MPRPREKKSGGDPTKYAKVYGRVFFLILKGKSFTKSCALKDQPKIDLYANHKRDLTKAMVWAKISSQVLMVWNKCTYVLAQDATYTNRFGHVKKTAKI